MVNPGVRFPRRAPAGRLIEIQPLLDQAYDECRGVISACDTTP